MSCRIMYIVRAQNDINYLNSIAPGDRDGPRVPTVVANGDLKYTERIKFYGGEEVADGRECG